MNALAIEKTISAEARSHLDLPQSNWIETMAYYSRLALSVVTVFVLLFVAKDAEAQSCQKVCDRYAEFAKKAGAPETITPLVQLYEACMKCSQGSGQVVCSTSPSQGPGNNMRCEYEAIGEKSAPQSTR
jgi:hypothetical protein